MPSFDKILSTLGPVTVRFCSGAHPKGPHIIRRWFLYLRTITYIHSQGMWDCTTYHFPCMIDNCHNHPLPFGAQRPRWSHFRLDIALNTICNDMCLPLVWYCPFWASCPHGFALGLTPKGFISLRGVLFTHEPSHVSIFSLWQLSVPIRIW